jgi:integrase
MEVIDATPTLRAFVDRYTAGHIDIAIKPSTAGVYRLIIKNHLLPRFGDHRMSEIRREEIEHMVGSLPHAPQAARSARLVLSSMFTKALQWGVLPNNFYSPTRGIKTKSPRMRERFLTRAERARVGELLETGLAQSACECRQLHWSIVGAIRLLSLTGMRSGEVFDLTWDMVDLERRVFRLPDSKTGQKAVPFSSAVAELLVKEFMPRRDPEKPWVLVSKQGTAVKKWNVGRAWLRIREAAQLGDMRIHDLRHSFASDALMSGVPLAVVGKVLGHKRPQTTARYAHISDEVVFDALERATARIVEAQDATSSDKTTKRSKKSSSSVKDDADGSEELRDDV